MRSIEEIARRILSIKLCVDKGMFLYHLEKETLTRKQDAKRKKMIKTMLKDQTILDYMSIHENAIYDDACSFGVYARIRELSQFEEKAFSILYLLGIEEELIDVDSPYSDVPYYEDIFFGSKNAVDQITKNYEIIEDRAKDLILYYQNLKVVYWRVIEKKYGYKKKLDFHATLKQSNIEYDDSFIEIRQNDLYSTFLKKRADKLTSAEQNLLEVITKYRIQTIEWLLFDKDINDKVTTYEDYNITELHTDEGVIESPSSLLRR